MTSISSVGSTLSYAAILANAQRQQQAAAATATGSGTSSDSSSATNVTLSDAAKAALAGKDFATLTADARTDLTALLTAAKATSPLDANGKLAIDMSKIDRRELWAIVSNSGDKFSSDEQTAAALEMQRRFDSAMSGPTAVARVTGAIKGLYTAALSYLDGASDEEKASPGFQKQKAAVQSGLDQLAQDPTKLPDDNASDPVLAYMDRLAAGETDTTTRDLTDVAADARTALDQQYLSASAAGTTLTFSSYGRSGRKVDFSDFDSRSLSAIALNTGSKFSDSEARAAKAELRTRSGAAILAGLSNAGNSSDPSAFAQNLISMYGGMSDEERQAAGWTPDFYSALVANYQSSVKIASMLSQVSSAMSANPYGASDSSGSSSKMSMLDYL